MDFTDEDIELLKQSHQYGLNYCLIILRYASFQYDTVVATGTKYLMEEAHKSLPFRTEIFCINSITGDPNENITGGL